MQGSARTCVCAVVLSFAAIVPLSVQAQEVKPQASASTANGLRPLGNSATFAVEYTNNVSATFSGDVSGTGYNKLDTQFRRTAEGLEAWDGTRYTMLIDPKSYFSFSEARGAPKLSDVIEQTFTRTEPQLLPNISWKLDRKFQNSPASWCSQDHYRVESTFETQAPEKYTLKINGQDTTLEVIPVVEKGYWYKCYAGKRYTRFLVSKDLNAVLSIGFLTYNPRGQIHELSFRANVLEITQ